jgi:hypothetical protein
VAVDGISRRRRFMLRLAQVQRQRFEGGRRSGAHLLFLRASSTARRYVADQPTRTPVRGVLGFCKGLLPRRTLAGLTPQRGFGGVASGLVVPRHAQILQPYHVRFAGTRTLSQGLVRLFARTARADPLSLWRDALVPKVRYHPSGAM